MAGRVWGESVSQSIGSLHISLGTDSIQFTTNENNVYKRTRLGILICYVTAEVTSLHGAPIEWACFVCDEPWDNC